MNHPCHCHGIAFGLVGTVFGRDSRRTITPDSHESRAIDYHVTWRGDTVSNPSRATGCLMSYRVA
ncbi:hypothetical protein [Pseudomonas sp. NPDC087639]|uniref:hypothetical protein n=1 Tax=Pseudomonas sp. NPDC087639 TaxID=3364445 RepID=UPI003826B842